MWKEKGKLGICENTFLEFDTWRLVYIMKDNIKKEECLLNSLVLTKLENCQKIVLEISVSIREM